MLNELLGMEYDDDEIIRMKHSGMCRRFPPVAVDHEEDAGFYSFNGDATDFFEFPHTEPNDWCGEFVKKPNVGVQATGNSGAVERSPGTKG